jgi:hypothetical protein
LDFYFIFFFPTRSKFTPPPHDQKHGQSLALLKGSFQAFTPNKFHQQVCLVELTKRGQAPTPFLGRTIKLVKYSCATSFVNTTTNSSATN